ncbi:hypothetical protein [Phaeodactylibacter luteus]|uniref:Uncharacterized protein n=1 Tax=Phaeodactylibacter luteus TaxID=1564516 RepID=A0A5C6RTC5_9BACT|nr:hypothetical protein [Phaeodactylibacter luteus]TXB65601.1 hypothetical protein FRY97_06360 [Phaeodactylibacter luteus]
MKYNASALLVVGLIFSIFLEGYAQESWMISGHSIPELKSAATYPALKSHSLWLLLPAKRQMVTLTPPKSQLEPEAFHSLALINPDNSYKNLGVFCKWEVQLEKAARFPVRFRLGEFNYVEQLEGKQPSY